MREKRQLEEERNRLQLDVKDMEVELKAYKVLLKEQRAAVELVYSVIDRAPQDSAGFALEPHMNADGFPVISKIDPLGSAAMSLEVHVGDIITLVDGHSVQDRHIDDVIKSLEGPIGSHVIIQARHPAGDQAPYVVSLARGAQNHSLCTPGSEDDDVNTNCRSAEDRKAARERSTFVMKMAEKALRYVCHLAYENSQVACEKETSQLVSLTFIYYTSVVALRSIAYLREWVFSRMRKMAEGDRVAVANE